MSTIEVILTERTEGVTRYSVASYDGLEIKKPSGSPIPELCRLLLHSRQLSPKTLVSIRRHDRQYPSFQPATLGYWSSQQFTENDKGISQHNFEQLNPVILNKLKNASE